MLQPAQRFFFDLAYSFPGQLKMVANLFQRHGCILPNAKIKTEHLGFSPVDGVQNFPDHPERRLPNNLLILRFLILIR